MQYQKQTGTDGHGQPIYDWETVDGLESLACSIETLYGDEAVKAQSLSAEATHRVECRFDSRIDRKHRLLFRDRELYIGHTDNLDEIGRFMYLLVSETRP